MNRSFQNFCLQTCRISICCWIAIAFFFVRVSLRPITSPLVDSVTKLHLLQMFFPGYYFAAFSLMILSFVTGLFLWRSPLVRPRMHTAFLILLGLSLIVSTIDWFWIYKPLDAMVREQLEYFTAPPANFRDYHTASRHINMTSVSFAALAMLCSFFMSCRSRPLSHAGSQAESAVSD